MQGLRVRILPGVQFGFLAQLVERRPEEPSVTGSNPVETTNTSGKVGTSTAVANVRLGVGSNPTMKYLPPRRDRYVRCRAEEVVKKYP
jgi:hypothetical protein